MELKIGEIYEGKITGITKFGVFVDLGDNTSGMVHISEVARTFVNDINEHVKMGDTVKVKLISIGDDGKIALSIKKALEPEKKENSGGHVITIDAERSEGEASKAEKRRLLQVPHPGSY